MAITIDNITDEIIERLRDNAGAVGDLEQVALCDRALAGDAEALALCVEAIRDAEAMAD